VKDVRAKKWIGTSAYNIMQLIPVRSSLLAAVGYDPWRHVLEIEFKNGALYQYLAVPEWEYERLLRAESHGAYFNAEIRNRYKFLVIR
jgi:hypothetical protein